MKLNEAWLCLVLGVTFAFASKAYEHQTEKEISLTFKTSSDAANGNLQMEKDVNVRLGNPFGHIMDTVTEIIKPLANLLCGDGSHGKNCSSNSKTQEQESSGVRGAITGIVGTIADGIDRAVKPIYPGTNWCGAGDVARSEADLGLFELTDNCCREHDNCPENIQAGETRFGLTNDGLFTRSHCDCDEKFYTCLKEAQTLISKKIGHTYFNILRPQCFRKDYPVIKCSDKSGILFRRCAKYEKNATAEQTWQWFDNKRY